ncbi:Uncharacterized protein BWINRA5_00289 [Bacillus mycoides]|nr:Uncharacterized protein BWINRA5_00289 [Bacillus mycoides]
MHYLKKSARLKGIRKGFLFYFLENEATF